MRNKQSPKYLPYPILFNEKLQESPNELSRLPVYHIDVLSTGASLELTKQQDILLVGVLSVGEDIIPLAQLHSTPMWQWLARMRV